MSKTMKAFVRENRIRISSKMVDENKSAPDWKDANHFKVILRRSGKRMTLYFSQGYGISGEPTAEGVLDCIASDSAGVENARSFEDWCGDYGYDTDSRKAERIFKVCEAQAQKLKNFLGDDLYKELLRDTARD